MFDDNEDSIQCYAAGDSTDDLTVPPCESVASPREAKYDTDSCAGYCQGSGIVKGSNFPSDFNLLVRKFQEEECDGETDWSNNQIDPKTPSPGDISKACQIGWFTAVRVCQRSLLRKKCSPEQWASNVGNGPNQGSKRKIFSGILQRHEIYHDDLNDAK
jgi:hypothetical protein